MKIGAARAAAEDWVMQEGRRHDGTAVPTSAARVGLSADAALSIGSDIDLNLIIEGPVQNLKLGKLKHRGALLEVLRPS